MPNLIRLGVALSVLTAPASLSPSAFAQLESSVQDVIVVTGTRTPQRQRDAAIRTDVLGDEILRASGARSLADGIAFLPLARSENNCQNCNTTEIQLLGLPGAYNQVLFDGLPLFTGVASVYGVEQIPAPLVEQIEVVKGGASALYGPGSVAGVINVISRKPTETQFSAYGAYELREDEPFSSLGAYGSLVNDTGTGSVSLFAQYDDQSPLDLNSDGFTELVDRQLFTTGLLARYQARPTTEITLNYQFTDEERRGGNRLDAPSFLANISEEITTDFHRGSLRVVETIGEKTQVEAVYGFSYVERETFYGGLGDVETDPTSADFDQQAFDDALMVSQNQFGETQDMLNFAEVRVLTEVGAQDLSLGVQYRQESVTDDNLSFEGEFLNTLVDEDFDTLGVFGQTEWTVSSTTRLIGGLRADWSSEVDDVILSPRAGIWFSPTEEWVIRGNVSTGFRAPEVFNEDIHIDTLGAAPIRTINSDDLTEERAVSYALGFDYDPLWARGALDLDGQIYYTDLKDTFFLGDIQTSPEGDLFQVRSNAGESKVLGAEFTARTRPVDALQLSLSGAYVEARFDEAQLIFEEAGQQILTRRYLKTPEWTGIAQAQYSTTFDVDAFLGLRYTGPMSVLNNNTGELIRSEEFFVVDLSATKHFDRPDSDVHFDIGFGVKNLFDEFQPDLETGANRDSDFVYGPRLPRTVFISLQADF